MKKTILTLFLLCTSLAQSASNLDLDFFEPLTLQEEQALPPFENLNVLPLPAQDNTRPKDRNYKCKYCDKTFTHKCAHATHERIHTGEKPYQCFYCDKTFTQNSNRTTHEKIHAGEKSYQCSYCDKRFTTNSSRTRHERNHTDEKPFQCQHCNKKFTQKAHCAIHEIIHTEKKTYQCSYCNKKFNSDQSRKRHKTTKHLQENAIGALTLLPELSRVTANNQYNLPHYQQDNLAANSDLPSSTFSKDFIFPENFSLPDVPDIDLSEDFTFPEDLSLQDMPTIDALEKYTFSEEERR